MGKEGQSVYLYVDLYLLGWQRPILETGFNHSEKNFALLQS